MLAELTIFPIDKGISVSSYVKKAIEYIKNESEKRSLKYELNSMGTNIEGEFDDVWDIIINSHKIMRKYSDRIYIIIKIDDRKGVKNAIIEKRKSIEDKLKNSY